MSFFESLGQYVSSRCATAPVIPPASLHENPLHLSGMNFTGVCIHMSSDVKHHMAETRKHERRYKKRDSNDGVAKQKLKEKQEEDARKLEEVKSIYPQCSKCKYHFKSDLFLERHVCSGVFMPRDALSMAMRYADSVLATRDFSVDGNLANVSALFPGGVVPSSYTTFEANFQLGWARVRRNMHPQFTTKVQEFIHRCWQEGVASRVKVSAEAVVARLEEEYASGKIRLAEIPVVGQVRGSYQSIGQRKITQVATASTSASTSKSKSASEKPKITKRRAANARACGPAKKRCV